MSHFRPQIHKSFKLAFASIATKKNILPASCTPPACCCAYSPGHKATGSRVADCDRKLKPAKSELGAGEGTKGSLHYCMRNLSTRVKGMN